MGGERAESISEVDSRLIEQLILFTQFSVLLVFNFTMSFTAEGTIDIDLADFWQWVYENYAPVKGVEYQYGVPRVNKSNATLEIDFAMGTECNPKEWVRKPEVCKQWEELK